MSSDRENPGGRVPLPGFAGAGQEDSGSRPAPDRRDGIGHARRVSNWTAAALIVGAGGATVALAHQALPVTAPAAAPASAPASAAAGSVARSTGPQATHSVATTSPSGVTVTTTTRTVNGKTVVIRARHAPAYQDN